jgi:hypothetical protein
MPRGRPGATLEPPRPTHPVNGFGLDAIPTATPDQGTPLDYGALLAANGVFRDPTVTSTGFAHWMTVASEANVTRRGRAVQQQKRYPVAMTAEEARALTKATGERHDWYCAGIQCPRCTSPLVGWVLGGRKFQQEHDHVTEQPATLYREIEVDVPDDADGDGGGMVAAEGA